MHVYYSSYLENILPVMATTFPSRVAGLSEPAMGETFAHANIVVAYHAIWKKAETALYRQRRKAQKEYILPQGNWPERKEEKT